LPRRRRSLIHFASLGPAAALRFGGGGGIKGDDNRSSNSGSNLGNFASLLKYKSTEGRDQEKGKRNKKG
jgi:hypothetical protein